MIKEFVGKTEKEAIDLAVSELGLERDKFDVEIVESEKTGFLFRKGKVKIRVHIGEDTPHAYLAADTDIERAVVQFLETLLVKMGYPGKVYISSREEKKICLEVESPHSGILIGKQGKNLDALQLLVNVYIGKIGAEDIRVIVDMEKYRIRREENLVRMARKFAEQVKRSKGSKLLEPMNPFERRLIHTALNEIEDIDTKSEGEGLYKQVRIYYRGK